MNKCDQPDEFTEDQSIFSRSLLINKLKIIDVYDDVSVGSIVTRQGYCMYV